MTGSPGSTVEARAAVLAQTEPSRFRRCGDDSRRLEQLLAGHLELAPHPAVALPDASSWTDEDPPDPNLRVLVASLGWLDVLRRAADVDSRQDAAGLYERWLRAFAARNRPADSASSAAWTDHAAGVRLSVIRLASTVLGTPQWLLASITALAEWSASPASYKGWGNHCLMQNSRLLSAAQTTHTLLFGSVDAQGVATEGAVAYHLRLHTWSKECLAKLRLLDMPLDREWNDSIRARWPFTGCKRQTGYKSYKEGKRAATSGQVVGRSPAYGQIQPRPPTEAIYCYWGRRDTTSRPASPYLPTAAPRRPGNAPSEEPHPIEEQPVVVTGSSTSSRLSVMVERHGYAEALEVRGRRLTLEKCPR